MFRSSNKPVFPSGGEEPLRRGARRHAAQVRQTVPQLRRVSQTNPNAQTRQGRGRQLTETPDSTCSQTSRVHLGTFRLSGYVCDIVSGTWISSVGLYCVEVFFSRHRRRSV